jgi:hypothetical protein
MFHFHQEDGFGHTLGFIPIYGFGSAGSYGTKATATRTYISEDHECGCSRAPAFAHIGAIATFANGVELMGINKVADIFIAFPYGQLYPKPVWLLGTDGRCTGTGGGSNFRHAAKIRIGKEMVETGL